MPNDPKQTVRLAAAHLSVATTLFLAGIGAARAGYVLTGLLFMGIAVLYLIFELVTSKPIARNVPEMMRLLMAIFAIAVFAGVNRDTINGFFGTSPTPPTPSPYGNVTAPAPILIQDKPSSKTTAKIPAAIVHKILRPSAQLSPAPTPTPSTTDQAQLTLETSWLEPKDDEHLIYLYMPLRNFGTRVTQATFRRIIVVENSTTHEVLKREENEPATVTFAPQQVNTVIFYIGGGVKEVYDAIMEGKLTFTVTMDISYRPNLDFPKTETYRVVIKPDLKQRKGNIVFSGLVDQ